MLSRVASQLKNTKIFMSIQILLNSNGGELFSALLKKIISLDFLGLKVACHIFTQDDIKNF